MTHREILEAMTGLLAALFTALLSTTIVATALPTIIGDLQGSQTAYAWVITTALLANAASTPIWGKLADLFNKKVLVQSAIVIFVIGSVIAGLAPNVTVLLVARVIQGIGMGGLTALVVAIIGSIVSPRDRGKYNGYTGAVMAVSMSGGPLLGGAIVDSPLGWRWCFFVCVPIAVIALVLLQRTLHIQTERKQNVSIDWLGATLLTAGVSILLIWVSFAGDYYEWISKESALYVGLGIAVLALTVWVESRAKSPIIPLHIVRRADHRAGDHRFGRRRDWPVRCDHLPGAVLPNRARLLTDNGRCAVDADGGRHARLLRRLGPADHQVRQVEELRRRGCQHPGRGIRPARHARPHDQPVVGGRLHILRRLGYRHAHAEPGAGGAEHREC